MRRRHADAFQRMLADRDPAIRDHAATLGLDTQDDRPRLIPRSARNATLTRATLRPVGGHNPASQGILPAGRRITLKKYGVAIATSERGLGECVAGSPL
jgi:hypothetical protein